MRLESVVHQSAQPEEDKDPSPLAQPQGGSEVNESSTQLARAKGKAPMASPNTPKR